jgi:predicted nucleic-acid-binding protein
MKNIKGIPIKVVGSPDKDVFSILNKEILGRFGLPGNSGYEDILLDFVNHDKIVPGLIESTIRILEQKGKEYKKDLQHLEYSGFLKHQNEIKPIVMEEVRDYLHLHLDFVLTEKDFQDIETGFRLRWNYSTDQIIGDGDFKRSVDSYLTSVESPMDREKMRKVVDRILEYLEIIGQWG